MGPSAREKLRQTLKMSRKEFYSILAEFQDQNDPNMPKILD